MMRNLRYSNCILSLHFYYCNIVTNCVAVAAFSAVSVCMLIADYTCSEMFNVYSCCMLVCLCVHMVHMYAYMQTCTHVMHTYDMYVCNVCAADLAPAVFCQFTFEQSIALTFFYSFGTFLGFSSCILWSLWYLHCPSLL